MIAEHNLAKKFVEKGDYMDLLEKLKAILAEKGIDEEIQTEILAELDGEPEGQGRA